MYPFAAPQAEDTAMLTPFPDRYYCQLRLHDRKPYFTSFNTQGGLLTPEWNETFEFELRPSAFGLVEHGLLHVSPFFEFERTPVGVAEIDVAEAILHPNIERMSLCFRFCCATV